MDYRKILDELTLEELVGQVMCPTMPTLDEKELAAYFERRKPGALFVNNIPPEKIAYCNELGRKHCKLPLIVAADVEHGLLWMDAALPNNMAWGAADDEELIETAGEQLAKLCRYYGIHYTFAPIVDLNLNPDNPECNIRSLSDDPKKVVKLASAYMRGLTKNGYMVTACKHFPGQGTDDRNSHFVAAENTLSRRKWMKTYGYIYKRMIEAGTASIMVGHISLESFEKEKGSPRHPLPTTISKSLMTDLLKKKLGFDGCIVSDAMSMIGVAAYIPAERMVTEFFKAGGDLYLYAQEFEYDILLNAVKSGELSLERLKDAAARVLAMKEKARLFEDQAKINSRLSDNKDELKKTAQRIADKSVKLLRNQRGTVPLSLPKGSRVLLLNLMENFHHEPPKGDELSALREAFVARGYTVDEIYKPGYEDAKRTCGQYDLVLINCRMCCRDYHGGSMRVGWDNIMLLWRGIVLTNKNVIFTSFGDPYKIREFPYMEEYINAFSFTAESQVAVAKLILGEISSTAKNPIDFKPYFRRGE